MNETLKIKLLEIKLHAVWNTSIKMPELRDKLTAISALADGLLQMPESVPEIAEKPAQTELGRYVGLGKFVPESRRYSFGDVWNVESGGWRATTSDGTMIKTLFNSAGEARRALIDATSRPSGE